MPQSTHGYHVTTPTDLLFDEDKAWDVWSLLARPMLNPISDASFAPLVTRRTKPSQLELLPAELLAMILSSSALKEKDIIAFGESSRTLWLHMLQHVHTASRKAAAPWAGVEMACVGNYLTELPEPFAKEGLVESSVKISEWGYMCKARKLNYAMGREYRKPSPTPEVVWRNAFYAYRGLSHAPQLRLRLRKELTIASSTVPSTDNGNVTWALRDLTTKDYVRCRSRIGKGGKRGYLDHSEMHWVRLDDVLMMYTCWSMPPRSKDSRDAWKSQGAWAGHRFDIVALEGEGLPVGDGWLDITDAVAEEAKELSKEATYRRQKNKRQLSKKAFLKHRAARLEGKRSAA